MAANPRLRAARLSGRAARLAGGAVQEFDGWPDDDAVPPDEPIDRDQLLTNATPYWLTRTGATSSWTYHEGAAGMPTDQRMVPAGVSHAGPGIRRLAGRNNNIVHWSDNDRAVLDEQEVAERRPLTDLAAVHGQAAAGRLAGKTVLTP